MWVSDYSWGWAPFHYGRWFNDPYYGWMWMPGYEWSPAWVAWRDGGDYYGWAPLRPGFNIGINISIGSYNPPVDYWCFAPRRYISSPRIYDYCMDRGRNVTIINNTTIINNYGRRNNVFINGPRRVDAERYTGRINPVRFRESSRPGRTTFRNNEVSVYRPRVQRDNNRQFTPRNVDRYERNGTNNGTGVRGDRNNNGNNKIVETVTIYPAAGMMIVLAAGTIMKLASKVIMIITAGWSVAIYQKEEMISREIITTKATGILKEDGTRLTGTMATIIISRVIMTRTTRRPVEQRNNEVRQPQNNNDNNRRIERRNVFERRDNNSPSQPNRREIRTDNRFERQQQPAQPPQRQEQRQPRQFENRSQGGGNTREQRSGNTNNRGERRSSNRRG